MPKVKANGIEIYYEIAGSGDPLVLIAGLGYPLWQWHKMVPFLAEHFQVIVFDNRGVGQTDKPSGPYTAQMLAADTAGLLSALGIESAAIAGHSMGGFIAQAMALDFPEKVNALILCSTNFGGPRHVPITPEAMAVLGDLTSDPLTRFTNGLKVSTAPGWAEANPDIVEEWTAWREANPLDLAGYQSQMAIGLALVTEEAAFEHRLSAISLPTMIIFGAHDKVVPPENANLLAEQIPGSQITIIPNAGHFFCVEVPETASRIIVDLLK
jgi:pimeloyl-ACP methyl ester carboxylesterase